MAKGASNSQASSIVARGGRGSTGAPAGGGQLRRRPARAGGRRRGPVEGERDELLHRRLPRPQDPPSVRYRDEPRLHPVCDGAAHHWQDPRQLSSQRPSSNMEQ